MSGKFFSLVLSQRETCSGNTIEFALAPLSDEVPSEVLRPASTVLRKEILLSSQTSIHSTNCVVRTVQIFIANI